MPGLVMDGGTVFTHTGLSDGGAVLRGARCGMEQRPLIALASDTPPPDPSTTADRALQGPGCRPELVLARRSLARSDSWRPTCLAGRADDTLRPMFGSQAQRG